MLTQAATFLRPAGLQAGNHAVANYLRARLTLGNVIRLALAIMTVVAIPIDLDHRVLSPAPNWPLVAVEPVALIAFLRCTLGSIR
jgi:hypothetical protein